MQFHYYEGHLGKGREKVKLNKDELKDKDKLLKIRCYIKNYLHEICFPSGRKLERQYIFPEEKEQRE